MTNFRTAAMVLTILSTPLALAGPKGLHLGMKLACKHYGDAWNSGSKGALYGVSTSDFAYQWGRMPDDLFASMPRGGGGGVAGSFKNRGGGYGEVSVSTSQGPMTFILVGHGFNWRVADIQKTGDGGQWVSVKNYLDASLSAREFMTAFHSETDESFRNVASSGFNGVFNATEAGDLKRVRRVLPPPALDVKPYLIFNGNTADITVHPPNGAPGDRVAIRLIHEGSWKVNDFEVDTARMRIASFQKAIPALACVTALGAFVNDPQSVDPTSFTANGELRDALVYARSQKPFPMQSGEKWKRLEVADDGATVFAHYPGRMVRMSIGSTGGPVLTRLEMAAQQGKWSDVAQALAIQKKVKEFSLASALSLPLVKPRAAAVASVLEKASAVERVVEKTAVAVAKPAKSPLPEPKRLVIAAAPAAKVESAQAVAVRTTTPAAPPAAPAAVVTSAVKAEQVETPATAPAEVQPTVQPVTYFVQPQQAPRYVPYQQARRCRSGRWR